MRETEKNERIAELEAKSANMLAEVRRLEKLSAELDRVAAARLDELVDARARALELEARFDDLALDRSEQVLRRLESAALLAELEPLAEVGRRLEAMPVGDINIERTESGGWFVGTDRGIEGGYVPLADALRAAGIGEEVVHEG